MQRANHSSVRCAGGSEAASGPAAMSAAPAVISMLNAATAASCVRRRCLRSHKASCVRAPGQRLYRHPDDGLPVLGAGASAATDALMRAEEIVAIFFIAFMQLCSCHLQPSELWKPETCALAAAL